MNETLENVAIGAGSAAVTYAAVEAWRRAAERTVLDNKPATMTRVDARALTADADTFQFKAGGDGAGVTDRLAGVKRWNAAAAGKVMVYEYADGRQVIADGHQRLGLAKRLMGEGHDPIKMDAIVLKERDGWAPRDVRAYAAIKNMHESSGASLDMAKVMRERPDLVTSSLPLSDAKVREARALSHLSEPAFKMVVGGAVEPGHAAAVGEAVKDATRHADMLKEMSEANVKSAQHARLYVQQAMAAPSVTETTASLFGEETTTRSLVKERAQVLDKALSSLKHDKRLFAMLSREADEIEAAGNRLAKDANTAIADTSARTAALVEKLATTRGHVSSLLDRAAEALAQGKSATVAAREFTKAVKDTMAKGGIKALVGDGPMPLAVNGGMQLMAAKTVQIPGEISQYIVDTDTGTVKQIKTGRRAGGKIVQDISGTPKGRAVLDYIRKQGEKSQTSFLPDPTTKEQVAAAAKSAGKPSVAQQPMDDGLFGSGMKQTDLVDMARAKQPGAYGTPEYQPPGTRAQNESYWTSRAERPPTVEELPPGAFKGTQREFESLSPGMRREIERAAKAADAKRIADAIIETGKAIREHGNNSPQANAAESTVHALNAEMAQKYPQAMPSSAFTSELNAAARQLSEARSNYDAVASRTSHTGEIRLAAQKLQQAHDRLRALRPPAATTAAEAMARPNYGRIGELANLLDRDGMGLNSATVKNLIAEIAADGPQGGSSYVPSQHPKAGMATATTTVSIKALPSVDGKTNPYTIEEVHLVGRGYNGQREVGRVQHGQYASHEEAYAAMEKGSAGKPSGWSDAAREASAKARGVAMPGEGKEIAARLAGLKKADLLTVAKEVGASGATNRASAQALRDAIQRRVTEEARFQGKNNLAGQSRPLLGAEIDYGKVQAATARGQSGMTAKINAAIDKVAGPTRPPGPDSAAAVSAAADKSARARRGAKQPVGSPGRTAAEAERLLAARKSPKADTVAALRARAKEAGIRLTGERTKAQILAALDRGKPGIISTSKYGSQEAPASPAPSKVPPKPPKTGLAAMSAAEIRAVAKELNLLGSSRDSAKLLRDRIESSVSRATLQGARTARVSEIDGPDVPRHVVDKARAEAAQRQQGRIDAAIEKVKGGKGAAPTAAKPRRGGKALAALGPLAIVGAGAVAFDSTRNQALAAGQSPTSANLSATRDAAAAALTIAGIGYGIGKAAQLATKVAPLAGKVLARALPVAGLGYLAYEIGKGAVKAYREGGGVTGAVKGGASAGADFATMGAWSHFAGKGDAGGQQGRLTPDQATAFQKADAMFRERQAAEKADPDNKGWSDQARIAAYMTRMTNAGKTPDNLPYGGKPRQQPASSGTWAQASVSVPGGPAKGKN